MPRSWTAAVIAAAVLAPHVGFAQGVSPVSDGTFRIESEAKGGAHGLAVSGYVYNDGIYRLTNVRLRVEVLDDAGRVLERGTGWVFGDLPQGGRGYFVVPVSVKGASYRVAVDSFSRVSGGGP